MSDDTLKKKFANLPEAEWIREMKEYHERTGTYRPADLRRLFGDPMRRVTSGGSIDFVKHYATKG